MTCNMSKNLRSRFLYECLFEVNFIIHSLDWCPRALKIHTYKRARFYNVGKSSHSLFNDSRIFVCLFLFSSHVSQVCAAAEYEEHPASHHSKPYRL